MVKAQAVTQGTAVQFPGSSEMLFDLPLIKTQLMNIICTALAPLNLSRGPGPHCINTTKSEGLPTKVSTN